MQAADEAEAQRVDRLLETPGIGPHVGEVELSKQEHAEFLENIHRPEGLLEGLGGDDYLPAGFSPVGEMEDPGRVTEEVVRSERGGQAAPQDWWMGSLALSKHAFHHLQHQLLGNLEAKTPHNHKAKRWRKFLTWQRALVLPVIRQRLVRLMLRREAAGRAVPTTDFHIGMLELMA
jgi:hypothetical protein